MMALKLEIPCMPRLEMVIEPPYKRRKEEGENYGDGIERTR